MDNKEQSEVKKGELLVAEPFMQDPNFSRQVVYVTDNQEGHVGFVLNNLVQNLTIGDVVEELSPLSLPVYIGGPVEHNTLHFLHNAEDLEDTVKVENEIYWGGNFEQLKEWALIGKLEEFKFKFFLGYSGWGPDQLENEIESDSWIVSSPIVNIFNDYDEDLWKLILTKLGGKYKEIANYPVDPRLN